MRTERFKQRKRVSGGRVGSELKNVEWEIDKHLVLVRGLTYDCMTTDVPM